MKKHPYASHLADLPRTLPLYLSRFEAEVSFAPPYLGKEDRHVVDEAFGELDVLVRSGFFAWAYRNECARAHVSVEWQDNGFTVLGEGAGLHHNVLVAALRMIVSLHHTPEQAHRTLVVALGSDAHALAPRSIWSELIRDVRLRGLEGTDDRIANRTNLASFGADDQLALPQGAIKDISTEHRGARLIVRAKDPSAILFGATLASIEGAFLGVCNSGGFRSPSRLDEMPEEGEFFVRTGDQGTELVIDGYYDEHYGLVELLSVMTKGRSAALVVSEDG